MLDAAAGGSGSTDATVRTGSAGRDGATFSSAAADQDRRADRQLKRVFGLQIEGCARCGGRCMIIAGIEERQVIAMIPGLTLKYTDVRRCAAALACMEIRSNVRSASINSAP